MLPSYCSLPLDIGFEVPDKFVVGYALDYNEYFRDLSVSIPVHSGVRGVCGSLIVVQFRSCPRL